MPDVLSQDEIDNLLKALSSGELDVSRVACNIVTGVGFLGAGTIFMYGNQIRGLVTSAGIWVMAAVGMAVGAGMYVLAIIATAITVVIQSMLSNKYFSYLDVKVPGRLRVCMDSETSNLIPLCTTSKKPYFDAIVKSAAPTATIIYVRSPAAF